MKIAEVAVDRPVTTVVGVLLVGLFGWLALISLPIQMKPTVDKPIIRIQTAYPGAAPIEVEQQVTDIFEEKVNAIQGLNKLTSTSAESVSTVSLEFDWGADRDARFLDVIEKANQISDLPEEAEKPVISAVSSVEEDRIMWLMISSDVLNVDDITKFAKNEIKDAIGKVDGVGDVTVFGGRERQIIVNLDPKSMISRGITIDKLRNTILLENRNVRGGFIDEGKMRYTLRTVGQFTKIADIENIVLSRTSSGTVYLRDVAYVEDSFEPRSSTVRGLNMRSEIALGISRKIGANVVETIERIQQKIDSLNTRFSAMNFKGQQASLRLKPAYNEADYIWQSMSFVSQNLFFGAVLAAAVLIFFLKSLRSVLIVSVMIPVCFISNFIFLSILGRTINIISLAGIAFAVGMTLDNAIVVIENIYRHLEMGKKLREACLVGIQEVWGAILASTLTTMAVFLPILYIKEEAGELFKDIALAISCSVAVSLVLSFTLVVMMSSRLMKKSQPLAITRYLFLPSDYIGRGIGFAFQFCVKLITGQYLRKLSFGSNVLLQIVFKTTLIALLVIPIFVVTLKFIPPMEYLPTGNRNMIILIYKVPPGTNVEKKSQISATMERKVEKILFDPRKGNSEDNIAIERMVAITSSGFNLMITVFKEKYARTPVENLPMSMNPMTQKPFRSSMDYLAFLLTGATFGTPGTEYAFAIRPGLFGRFANKGFNVEVSGPDIEKLKVLADEVEQRINQMGKNAGYGRVTRDFEVGLPEIRINIDRERASELGLRAFEVASVVETFVAGKKTGKFRDGSDDIDIVVKVPEYIIDDIEQLKMVQFFVEGVGTTNLDSVTDIYTTNGPTQILHSERSRAITLSINLDETKPLEEAIDEVRNEIIAPMLKNLPGEYNIDVSGSASDLKRTQDALKPNFLLSVAIIYLLLCSLFESFFFPFIIMFSVPLAISGGIFAIVWNEAPFDMLTVLGFFILGGIVVNNAILVVHQALNFMKEEGYEPHLAISESVRTRLRPAFMSTITTVFGLIPMCIQGAPGSELYSGLATAIAGGLVFSTFLTLVLVPGIQSLLIDCGTLLKICWGTIKSLPHKMMNLLAKKSKTQ
ncbi:efflux RND transporter permease subunit [Candidatus Uabimicrobium amorphum]|uniref:Acriflavine resistance protein B n=1 Tax=Uabimicrobium amorphum TaxID=2596890 RepID=A0A5S9IKX4_UABAM|nr:efflux RND transporter permease subunit [Candidatus Uabimicrobium amorphum]BBM83773.1 acriflavine resistance protein B [Candidatus Uabimicrobium amorphum]